MSDNAYRKAMDAVAARPCQCVRCGSCRGTGNVWRPTGGYPEEDIERCDDCDGSGITEQCDRCAEMDEIEEAFR